MSNATGLRPTRKVTAATLALLAWELIESIMRNELGLDLSEATWSSLNVLIPAIVAYMVPEGS